MSFLLQLLLFAAKIAEVFEECRFAKTRETHFSVLHCVLGVLNFIAP